MKRILIVEDDAILAMVMRKTLQYMGYQVVATVNNGRAAIQTVKDEIAKGQAIDVILMDIVIIGEMDGIEAMEEIRTFSDIPVVYLTGNSDPRSKMRAEETRYTHFLVKPVDNDYLKMTLERIFETQNP